MLDEQKTALATRCLWALQEAAAEIQGLVFTETRGVPITSTMSDVESIQRLSALSATLFLLGEYAAETWGRGATDEVQLLIRGGRKRGRAALYVGFKPVGDSAVLVAVHTGMEPDSPSVDNVDRAARYLDALLQGEEPPELRWRE